MDKKADSSIISPSMDGVEFAKVLGGLPKKMDVEAIMKVNNPGAREAAPGSFRPEARGGGDNETQ